MYKTYLQRSWRRLVVYLAWLVVSVGIVCRRIVKKCLELEKTYRSEASKAGEGLSFVTRKANTFNSVAMEQSKPLI